ncbi:chromate transporter [Rugamonas sp. FT82W]|uniref:Chromate transporter n=1 Tax=Duganella vulcania TaxID=2692166 RepID=A0A845FXF2_9BURK|nr:chromate transporter [Duganella vulcania]MYM87203.1 chromate transporter [Duganella vulcania]
MPIDPPRARPNSLFDLFVSFTILALQGFGGVLAVVQRELVERKRWLTQEEFVEEWAVAQIMPGPNVVNLALMIGSRYYGLRGGMVALAGMLTLPLLLVLALAMLHSRYAGHPGVTGALRGMAAVSAGMIAATGLKLASALGRHPLPQWMNAAIALLCVVFVVALRLPLAYTLLILGSIGVTLTYRKMKGGQP